MLRLRSDLVELCTAGAEGRLNEKSSDWDERPALGVVLAAGGYPGDYRNGESYRVAAAGGADGRSSMPAHACRAMTSSPAAAACCA